MAQLTLERAAGLAQTALRKAGASEAMARSTARALVLADAQNLSGHGLSRVPQYSTHLRNGRADGKAVAAVLRRKGAALLIDAQQGLAFPACDLAITEAIATARNHGVCFAGITNSHHCGVLVDHLRPVAAAGMVGLAFANSPAAMPAAGGRHAVFGTNPVAAWMTGSSTQLKSARESQSRVSCSSTGYLSTNFTPLMKMSGEFLCSVRASRGLLNLSSPSSPGSERNL